MLDAGLDGQIRALEERLLTPEVRRSREELTKLLADDFLELGSSGRTFDREAIITLLQDESPLECSLHDFSVKQLATVLGTVSRGSKRGDGASRRDGARSRPIFGDGCDLGEIVRAELDFDVVGHYARPDVFKLRVDERASRSVTRESDST